MAARASSENCASMATAQAPDGTYQLGKKGREANGNGSGEYAPCRLSHKGKLRAVRSFAQKDMLHTCPNTPWPEAQLHMHTSR